MPTEVVINSINGTKFGQQVLTGNHVLFGDEPIDAGGTDIGPTPYEHLLAALGTCTSITLRMYAERKEWDLGKVTLRLNHERIHAKDCEDCETRAGMLDQITTEIQFGGELDESQTRRLLEIAKKCPVHQTLSSAVKIQTELGSFSGG